MAHQNHLAYKRSLLMGEWALQTLRSDAKLFATVAKVSHIWREKGEAIYKMWIALHGVIAAHEYALRCPSKCIAQRWGSAHASAKFLLKPPRNQTVEVLQAVLLDSGEGKAKRQRVAHNPLDEVGQESYQAWATKFG